MATQSVGAAPSRALDYARFGDPRFSDARAPTTHAGSHASGGSDPVTPASIGALAALGPIATKTASYTLTASDSVVVFNTTSGAMTATLPTAVGSAGRQFTIKKLGGSTANPLTIATTAGQTIDGAASEIISVAGGFRALISDGTNWHIIGGKVEPVIVGPVSLTTANAALAIDASIGSVYRFTCSASATTCNLPVPTNPIDGDPIIVQLLASVATTLTVNASILLTGGLTATAAVPINKRWFGGLSYVAGVGWFLLASALQS